MNITKKNYINSFKGFENRLTILYKIQVDGKWD